MTLRRAGRNSGTSPQELRSAILAKTADFLYLFRGFRESLIMIHKRILVPDRVRRPPMDGWSWIDRRFVRDFAPRLSREAIVRKRPR